MRSTRDPIHGLQQYIEEWGLATEQELKFKQLDKEAKAEVDAAVEEAKASPFPSSEDVYYSDVYIKGTGTPFLRGREREEDFGEVKELVQRVKFEGGIGGWAGSERQEGEEEEKGRDGREGSEYGLQQSLLDLV
ncbi:hypothetical protein F5887DRAFT_917104 [Amanita rubescens]|nr:hypothetical protein F5887DRAFT_917104 [Amanita rubescens]